MLRLGAPAVDDGTRGGALDSIGDVVDTIAGSTEVASRIEAALLAANPLKPFACDQMITFPGPMCVVSTGFTHEGAVTFAGTSTTTLDLVPGGIRARITLRDVRIGTRVNITLFGMSPMNELGTVSYPTVDVDATFDVGLDSSGATVVRVRPTSVTATVSTPATLSGYSPLVTFFPYAQTFADGPMRTIAANAFDDTVAPVLESVLDELLLSVGTSVLGASFDVPRIDASGNIPVSFMAAISSTEANASRILSGASTRFSTVATHTRLPDEVPLLPVGVFTDPGGSDPAAVAIQVGALQQVLQALWRAGYLDVDRGAPDGSTVSLSAPLPPVVKLTTASHVVLDLAFEATIASGLFDGAVVTIGARVGADVSLASDDLAFDNVRVEELRVAAPDESHDATLRAELRALLRPILAQVGDRALSDSLPALPIPLLRFPASFAAFGLPAGQELGLVGPAYSSALSHVILRGSFGER